VGWHLFFICRSYSSSLWSHIYFILAFQVIDYSLIIEGVPNLIDHLGSLDDEPVSCRSIFQCIPPPRDINLAVYIYFNLRNATCRNLPFYTCIDKKDDFEKLEGGAFHLLRVTHKFPLLHKVCFHFILYIVSVMFLEASPSNFHLELSQGKPYGKRGKKKK
jgi:hypothetical protein